MVLKHIKWYYNYYYIFTFAAAQHVRVQKRWIPMAVQLEKRFSIDLLVDVQSRVWLFAADYTAANRPFCWNHTDLPVPGYRTTGLVRRECTIIIVIILYYYNHKSRIFFSGVTEIFNFVCVWVGGSDNSYTSPIYNWTYSYIYINKHDIDIIDLYISTKHNKTHSLKKYKNTFIRLFYSYIIYIIIRDVWN